MRRVFLSIVFASFALALPASAAAATPSFEARNFATAPGAPSDVQLDLTVPTDQAAVAKSVIYVPAGYGLNTSAAPGTNVGTVDAVAEIGGTTGNIPTGNIVADDPASYVTNPQAQACAPGTHAAVWVAHVGGFAIPIFVDQTSATDASLGAFKLQSCFTPPEASDGARLVEAILGFTKTVFTNPTTAGLYLWRTFVTPFAPGTSTPNVTGTYELRSAVFIPATLTLKKASYNRKTKVAVLSGKFTLLGHPLPGIPVFVLSLTPNGDVALAGRAKTNKQGVFTLRLHVRKTRFFGAIVLPGASSCDTSPPSGAPAGCVNETDTEFFSNILKVVAKK